MSLFVLNDTNFTSEYPSHTAEEVQPHSIIMCPFSIVDKEPGPYPMPMSWGSMSLVLIQVTKKLPEWLCYKSVVLLNKIIYVKHSAYCQAQCDKI